MQWVEVLTTNELVNLIQPMTSYCWWTDDNGRQWATVGLTKLLTSSHIHHYTTIMHNDVYKKKDKMTTMMIKR